MDCLWLQEWSLYCSSLRETRTFRPFMFPSPISILAGMVRYETGRLPRVKFSRNAIQMSMRNMHSPNLLRNHTRNPPLGCSGRTAGHPPKHNAIDPHSQPRRGLLRPRSYEDEVPLLASTGMNHLLQLQQQQEQQSHPLEATTVDPPVLLVTSLVSMVDNATSRMMIRSWEPLSSSIFHRKCTTTTLECCF